MAERVPVPLFELVGPPCQTPGCKGVLTDSLELRTQDFFRHCSVCGGKFDRMPAQEKLDQAVRTIERVLEGDCHE